MLVGGVNRQMEAWREGFDAVFPSSSLRIFYPEELEMERTRNKWWGEW